MTSLNDPAGPVPAQGGDAVGPQGPARHQDAAGPLPARPGDAAGAARPAPPGRWQISIGSARGAAHQAGGLPNQDAAARDATLPGGAVTVAIADGHGHSRHFRSGAGSALAVGTACQVAGGLATALTPRPGSRGRGPAEVEAAVRAGLAPVIVERWRAGVAAQIRERPYTAQEQARLDAAGDGPEIPYGATLLVATVVARWLICAQIGDGDMLAICPDGRSFSPLPVSEKLDGERTRSLCQEDALAAFQVSVLDLGQRPLVALLLATDGYGNAQTADPWQPGVGRDLARLSARHDHAWFDRQLPNWAERCASADGSGDDTTIALLVHPDPAEAGAAAARRARARAADTVSVPVAAANQVAAANPGTSGAAPVQAAAAHPPADHAGTARAAADHAGTVRASSAAVPGGTVVPGSTAGPASTAGLGGASTTGPGAARRGPARTLPPGITSSRRPVVMIAIAIALAAVIAVILVMVTLGSPERPRPAAPQRARPAGSSSAAPGATGPGRASPPAGTRTAHASHRSGRPAGHHHERNS